MSARRYCSAPDCGCDDIEAETCPNVEQRTEGPPQEASPRDRVPPPPEDPEARRQWKEHYHAFNYGVEPTTLQRGEAPPRESAWTWTDERQADAAFAQKNLPASWQAQAIARDLRTLQQQKAHETGAFVGSVGLGRDLNPHPEGTALWISWNAGWKEAAR